MKKVGQDTGNRQIVEVRYGDNTATGKTYSYLGGGNLRSGQVVNNAPVTHPQSGKNYTTKAIVVATHSVYGAQVGDNTGVQNGVVTTIPKPLKYLPGDKELLQDREVSELGGKTAGEYMSQFNGATMQDRLGRFIGKSDTSSAKARLIQNFG